MVKQTPYSHHGETKQPERFKGSYGNWIGVRRQIRNRVRVGMRINYYVEYTVGLEIG